MRYSKYSKVQKSSKEDKKQTIKEEVIEVPKINKYDVLLHLEQLLNGDNYLTDVSNYINRFFFKYVNDIFYDNGETFELLSKLDAKNRIPANFKMSLSPGTYKQIKKFFFSFL